MLVMTFSVSSVSTVSDSTSAMYGQVVNVNRWNVAARAKADATRAMGSSVAVANDVDVLEGPNVVFK